MSPPDEAGPLWRRLFWLMAIWAGSVLALAAVAFPLRLLLKGH